MELHTPREAAKALSVSYPTLKQWIYRHKIESVKTPGGHHRIPQREIDRILAKGKALARMKPSGLHAISGRNKLLGKVVDVQVEGLLAQITLDVAGQRVTAIVTRGACEDLGLRVGVSAYALVKATEVMVIRA